MRGIERPVYLLSLGTGEVLEQFSSLSALAGSSYFRETKKATARQRLQKAMDRALKSCNPYAEVITDVPGFRAGFAWAKPGDKVSASHSSSQYRVVDSFEL